MSMNIEFNNDMTYRLVPFKSIKRKDKTQYVYVKSGYDSLDKKIGGFILGQLSVWSGLNGSGKSNFLNQQILMYLCQGYKVMLFSGEMMDYSIKNILYRMVATKRYLSKSEDGTYWYLGSDGIKTAIDMWVGDNLYVYNNKFGAKPKEIMETIKEAKERLGVQIVILDNLMTMDLKDLNKYNKYEAQSEFAKLLANTCKNLNVHIHVVMHPTKTTGYLRKNDISGSADLTNAVDNVFIVHRNNADFQRAYKEFNKKVKDDFFSCDTYIEVCKNREEGIQDLILPFYFLPETKQIVETKGKEIMYVNKVIENYQKENVRPTQISQ